MTLRQQGLHSPKARPPARISYQRFRSPGASLNSATRLKWLLSTLPSAAKILDLGSGTRRLRPGAVNLEIGPFENVDVIGDGSFLPFPSNYFDAIVCQAVLEHVKNPSAVIAEMLRILKPGGFIYAEIPFLQGYHADPNDYRRYTLAGIETIFSAFRKIETGVCVGPSSTLAWILKEYFSLFFGPGRIRKAAVQFFGWLTFWIKYLDLLLVRNPDAHVIASGLYYFGKK